MFKHDASNEESKGEEEEKPQDIMDRAIDQ